MRVLWLAVARAGSKGVINKNLREIQGLSLIGWKSRAAYAAGADKVVLSTDSAEIAAEGVRHGCTALMRPPELATDEATSASVVRHALETLRVAGNEYDAVNLLEPSSPFTTAAQHTVALRTMEVENADLVVGMKRVEPHPLFVGEQRVDASVTPIILAFQNHARRRQDYLPSWSMSGSLYLFKVGMFLDTGDIYGGYVNKGMLVDKWTGLEIDTPEDLEMAEYAAGRRYVRPEAAPLTPEQQRQKDALRDSFAQSSRDAMDWGLKNIMVGE